MSDQVLTIGGPLVQLARPEEWEAPSGPVAQRWKDEIDGRGGYAEIHVSADGTGMNRHWYVRVIMAPRPAARR